MHKLIVSKINLTNLTLLRNRGFLKLLEQTLQSASRCFRGTPYVGISAVNSTSNTPDSGHPRQPSITVPAHACDVHAHVCGPQEQYPVIANRLYTTPPFEVSVDELEALQAQGVRGVRCNIVDLKEDKGMLPMAGLKTLAEKIKPLGWYIEMS